MKRYDANFKITMVNAAEAFKSCAMRRWRNQKERLKNTNTQQKAFCGPQSGRFQEIDRQVCEYVAEKHNDGMPVTRAIMQLKALEVAKELNIPPTEFKASFSWCKRMLQRTGLSLSRKTVLLIIINWFKQCGISNVLDGSKDNVWEEPQGAETGQGDAY
uniref:HTH CENPB-type domain-containing protein n=1 Tax=Mola mola TaxID=94237 RepID=A0A3Q4AXE9_MOLML